MIKKNKNDLTEIEYLVTQEDGTEPPFQNEYWNHFEKGIYVDKISGKPLFTSEEKFESDCGWPRNFININPFFKKIGRAHV